MLETTVGGTCDGKLRSQRFDGSHQSAQYNGDSPLLAAARDARLTKQISLLVDPRNHYTENHYTSMPEIHWSEKGPKITLWAKEDLNKINTSQPSNYPRVST